MSKRMLIRDCIQKAIAKTGESYSLYYNPTGQTTLKYPCIIYRRKAIRQRHADNLRYHTHEEYQITVIDKRVESPVVEALINEQYCYYNSEFISDNMNHTLITINTGGLSNG